MTRRDKLIHPDVSENVVPGQLFWRLQRMNDRQLIPLAKKEYGQGSGWLDTIYPDGMAMIRASGRAAWIERLSRIELIAEPKLLPDSDYYTFIDHNTNWRVRLPRTEIEIPVKSRQEGIRIIWELREAINDVLRRYTVHSKHPITRELRTHLAYHRGRELDPPDIDSLHLFNPSFLACL